MATFSTWLVRSGLQPLDIPLEPDEKKWGTLYVAPKFGEWLKERLAADEESPIGADLTIVEQLQDLFRVFITGRQLVFDEQFHSLWPGEKAVWELKTADLRIFGWFANKDFFIALFGDFKDRIVDYGLYPGYRNEVIRIRSEMGGDGFCTWETGEHDVISVRYR
jgi:hypothetical protein